MSAGNFGDGKERKKKGERGKGGKEVRRGEMKEKQKNKGKGKKGERK